MSTPVEEIEVTYKNRRIFKIISSLGRFRSFLSRPISFYWLILIGFCSFVFFGIFTWYSSKLLEFEKTRIVSPEIPGQETIVLKSEPLPAVPKGCSSIIDIKKVEGKDCYYSPIQNEALYLIKRDGGYFVLTSKEEFGPYESIDDQNLSFSGPPSSRKSVFEATYGQDIDIFIGTRKIATHRDAYFYYLGDALFSSKGNRVAYVIRRKDKNFAVIDGVESSHSYDDVGGFSFSPDETHTAYGARVGERAFVVRDGKEGSLSFEYGPHNPYPYLLTFSPDNKHFVYRGRKDAKWVVVFDEIVRTAYENPILNFFFSPNSERFAYQVGGEFGSNGFIVVDSNEYENSGMVEVGGFSFSSDSQHFAYAVLPQGIGSPIGDVVIDGVIRIKSLRLGSFGMRGDSYLASFPGFSENSKELKILTGVDTLEVKTIVVDVFTGTVLREEFPN